MLAGDLAAAIGELPSLGVSCRCTAAVLIQWLLENDSQVDEINLLIAPVILGQGQRLFPAAGPAIALDLADSRTLEGGDDPGLPTHRAPGMHRPRREARDMVPELRESVFIRSAPSRAPRPAHGWR